MIINIIKYINNYTKSELISFFKLNDSYTNEELEKNEEKLKNRILNSNYDSKYKYEILIFILEAKDKLKIKNKEKEKETEQQNNIGKIMNQNHDYPIIQKPSIMKNNVNSYGTYLIKTNYIFDTRYRDDFFRTVPTDSTFSLPITLNNVISITLSTIQFPNTFFNFNEL